MPVRGESVNQSHAKGLACKFEVRFSPGFPSGVRAPVGWSPATLYLQGCSTSATYPFSGKDALSL